MHKVLRGIAAASILSVVFLCTACSAGASPPAAGTNGHASKIVFIPGTIGDPFYVSMRCGAQAEATAEGATLTTQAATTFSAPLQVPILNSVVASKPDAILIAPTDSTALEAPIAQAKAQGIKMVLVDTTLKDPSAAVSSISSDNTAGGKAAFTAIKQLVPNGGKVLVVAVQPGVSTDDLRVGGFESAIKADPSYQYLGAQYSQQDAAKAASIVNAELQKTPDIAAIFATNDLAALGAATGIRQAGKQQQVKLVGFDAETDQVAALRAGTVQALIAQQPSVIGADAVKQAIKAIKGQQTTRSIKTKFTIITKANLDTAAGKNAIYQTNC